VRVVQHLLRHAQQVGPLEGERERSHAARTRVHADDDAASPVAARDVRRPLDTAYVAGWRLTDALSVRA